MSKIAPGKWNPLDRRLARFTGYLVGVFCLVASYKLGMPLLDGLKDGRDISVWWMIVPLAPFAIGCAALIPNVTMPIVIRLIDKFLTDTPEK